MKINYSNIEQLDENIFVLHNFVSEYESNQYLDIVNSVDEEEWWKENSGWYKGKFLYAGHNKNIQIIAKEIINRFSNIFDDGETYTYGDPMSIHRMLPNQDMFTHADFSELDNLDKNIVLFNTAIYHNTVEGGEIYYPEIGIEYHPQKGDIVLHPGTTKYRHGVKMVKNETRYISTLWVADKNGMSIKTSGARYD